MPTRQLVIARANGEDPRVVTMPGTWHCAAPQWGPDGQAIAFHAWPAHQRLADYQVWTCDADGKHLQHLGPGSHPTWFADGRQLACQVYGGGAGVVIMNRQGESRELIRLGVGAPRFSHQGRHLALLDWGKNILLFDTVLQQVRPLLPENFHPQPGFAWSPDDRQLAFVDQPSAAGEGTVWIVDLQRSDAPAQKILAAPVLSQLAWKRPTAENRWDLLLAVRKPALAPGSVCSQLQCLAGPDHRPIPFPDQRLDGNCLDPSCTPDGSRVALICQTR